MSSTSMSRRSSLRPRLRLHRGMGCLTALLALASSGVARGDWPMARHDARRSGLADGKAYIEKPEVAWSAYLGGAIRSVNMLVADADADGKGDIIYATGGAVVAKRVDDVELWRTLTHGLGTLDALADLDGDGQVEIVAHTSRQTLALDLKTGAIRWAQADDEMGAISLVRVADVTGDKTPDLVIGECGGCGASKPQTGFVYAFGGGFSAPSRLELPKMGGATTAVTAVDLDGTGPLELLLSDGSSALSALNGNTGNKIASVPMPGQMAWYTACLPAKLNATPGQELVCIAATSPEPTPASPELSRVFALGLGAGSSLDVLWQFDAPAGESLSNTYYDLLVDLDGDGANEVVATGRHADGSFTTHVLDAKTGAQRAKLDGHAFAGTAPLFPNQQRRALLTTSGTKLSAFRFNSFGPNKLTQVWTLDNRVPITQPDRPRMMIAGAAAQRPVSLDLNGDGRDELFTQSLSGAVTLTAHATTNMGAVQVASLSFPGDTNPIALWTIPELNEPGEPLALAQTDGILHLLDSALAPTARSLRFGGYYAAGGWREFGKSPVAASLGSAAGEVVVSDSRGALLRLDASSATTSAPPKKVWEAPLTYAPAVIEAEGGGKTIAALSVDSMSSPPTYRVRALRPEDGGSLWEVKIDGAPLTDLVVGNFDTDDTPDVALQYTGPGGKSVLTAAFSGKDGSPLWTNTEGASCGFQQAGLSAADWDGDGYDDVLHQIGVTRVISGKDGASSLSGKADGCYALPLLADIDGDEQDEVILHAGFEAVRVLDHDLQTPLFASKDDDRPYPYGAVARCGGGEVFVEGSWKYPARLKITNLAAGSIGVMSTMVLADGARYGSEEEARAAGAGMGQLTATTVHANLRGDGKPVALVGSTDGWLYGVDPCSGDLAFSVQFGAAVGEAVFGDTDGDGLDEILVTVADGYLYSLHGETPTNGTGGAGGMGGAGGAGGEGGATQPGAYIPLYGRGGCYCGVPAMGGDEVGLWALGLLGIGTGVWRRRRRASRR